MKRHYFTMLLLMILINFILPRLMPGDPFLYLSGGTEDPNTGFSVEQIAQYRSYYGLDKPLIFQFFSYLHGLIRGNLGYSLYFNRPVLEMILLRIPWTLLLVLSALFISVFFGVLLGILSAWKSGRRGEGILYFIMIMMTEIPAFLLGIALLFFLAAKQGWFPLSGALTPFREYSSSSAYWGDLFYHAALPVLTLSLSRIGDFYLMARSSMITVLKQDYMITAKAKGLPQKRILFRHALINALPPVIARVFMSLGMMLGGSVLVENLFQYPGLGRLMRDAVTYRDYVLIQGIFFFISLTVLFMNWFADRLYLRMDVRVRI